MRCVLVAVLLTAVVVCVRPAEASLPYYNSELGYTIWLSSGWSEAPATLLTRFEGVRDGLTVGDCGWRAGYALAGSPQTCLLVSTIQGKVVSRAGIANFNRFVVRNMLHDTGQGAAHLKKAHFLTGKNMLRLEMDLGGQVTSVVYIIYMRTGMLKFTGLTRQGDTQSVQAIDEMITTLYLDNGLGQ